ncbi:MAG: kinase to dihydroxyacetone kinase [Anaerococcus sp.]|nr:kinase to dihydroxyacetone kinase [Anaerococcus sp.]
MTDKLEFKFDCQMLIAGEDLDEDEIFDYITANLEGDSLLAVGDEELIKIHFHSNKPWEVLEYAASLGEIHDVVIENMQRQAEGLQG